MDDSSFANRNLNFYKVKNISLFRFSRAVLQKRPFPYLGSLELAVCFLILESSVFSDILAFLSQLTPQWAITHSLFRIVISKWNENQSEVTIMCCLSLIRFPCKWHFVLLAIRTEPETVLLPNRNEAHRNSSVLRDFTSHQFEEKKLAKILEAHSECSNNSLEP